MCTFNHEERLAFWGSAMQQLQKQQIYHHMWISLSIETSALSTVNWIMKKSVNVHVGGFLHRRQARKYVAGIYEAHEFLCIIFTSFFLLFKSQCSISLSLTPSFSLTTLRCAMCYVCDSKVIKNPMYANQCFSHPIAHQYSTRKSKFQIEFCVMNMWTSPFFAYLMTCLSSFLLLLLTTLFPYTNPPSMPLMCSFLLLFGKTHEICSMNYRIFDWLAITLPPTHISCLNFWLFSKDFCDKGRKS